MASSDGIVNPYNIQGQGNSSNVVTGCGEDQMVCTAMKILMCPPHEGISREYHELPQHQQNQVWSDLTGSEAASLLQSQESMESITRAISELKRELNNIPSKEAYELALANFPQYADHPKFLVRFLLAERFECRPAAVRLVLHFEQKLALFGPDKLGREILLSDLDKDDMYSMNLGYMQILSQRDFSGRPVIFMFKAISECYRSRENILRVAWYIFNNLAQEESAQKVGIIIVVYNNGGFPEKGMDYEKSRRFGKVLKAIPLRVDGVFVCFDEAPWQTVVETFSLMVDKFLRIRLRALPGSQQECMYKLMSIGIPFHSLPVDANNSLLLDNHQRWLYEQHRLETGNR